MGNRVTTWFRMVSLCSVILFLGACASEETAQEIPFNDAPGQFDSANPDADVLPIPPADDVPSQEVKPKVEKKAKATKAKAKAKKTKKSKKKSKKVSTEN